MARELDSLITALAAHRVLATPERDEQGRFFLLLDGELEVGVLQHGDRIIIEAGVGPVPADPVRAEALLARVLQTGFARLKRRHEVMSIDPDGGGLVLFVEHPLRTMDLKGFERAIAMLAGGLEYWRALLNRDTAPVMSSPALQVLFP